MADDLKLKLQIGGDGSGAVAAVDGVEKSLGGMGSTSEKVNAQLKAMAAAAEGVEVPAAAVDSVGKLKTEAAGAAKGIGDLAAKEAQLASETDSARAKVDQLHASLVNTAAAEKTLAAGANSVNSAFSALNLRSADKIRADILAVDQALVKLSSNSKVSGAEFDRAWAAGQEQLVKLRGCLLYTSPSPRD